MSQLRHGELPAELLASLSSPDLSIFPAHLRSSATSSRESEELSRSYVADGRGVAWRVDRRLLRPSHSPAGRRISTWRIAVDAEVATNDLPAHVRLHSRLDPDATPEQAVAAWTQAEVVAKLTDTPILLRIREFGLTCADLSDVGPIALHTLEWGDLLVTVGAKLARPCA